MPVAWIVQNGVFSPAKPYLSARCLNSDSVCNTISHRAYTHDVASKVKAFMADNSELPLALRSAYLAMHRKTEAQFAPYGVTADQFVLLSTLSRGNAITQRELARRMPSDPSTVRAMLVLLETQGLVERDVHPSDSRARTVALTAAGKRKFRQLWNASKSIRTKLFEAIHPDDAVEFIRILTRIAESMNNETLFESNRMQENEV
jgi:DNA-binding MarR family transcriptional regulator